MENPLHIRQSTSGRRPAQEDPRMSAMLTQQQRATDALSIECRRYFGGAVVCDGQRGHLQSHGTEGFDRPVLYPTVTIVMRKAAAFESVPQCRVLADSSGSPPSPKTAFGHARLFARTAAY